MRPYNDYLEDGVSKKPLFMILLLVLLVVPVTAQEADVQPWVCPEGYEGQTLNFFNWATYIAENTIPDFEKLCGVTVVSSFFSSNDEMMTAIRTGNAGYDLIVPSDYAVTSLIEEGLVQPLDKTMLPNFTNLAEDMQSTLYDENNAYSIPYLLGTFGIGYNVNTVEGELTSWTQFFEHDGPVAWTWDARIMLSVALLMTGNDPNSSDPAAIEEAKQYLIDHNDNVTVIAQDDGQELLARGEVDMAIEYNGDIFQISTDCACDDFAYAIPQEGSGLSAGFILIPKDAPNPELAHVFLDYLLHPQVAADIANYTTYPTPNQAAIDAGLIDAALLENPAIYPPEDARENLYLLALLDPETEELYNRAWTDVQLSFE